MIPVMKTGTVEEPGEPRCIADFTHDWRGSGTGQLRATGRSASTTATRQGWDLPTE